MAESIEIIPLSDEDFDVVFDDQIVPDQEGVIQPPEPAITPPGLNTISRKRPVQLVRIT
jgi:hypothetical protein